MDGFTVRNIFNAMERDGVGDEGDVDGFTVFIFDSMDREEVSDAGDVDGFAVLSNYVTADFSTGHTSSEMPHKYADELSSAWERLVATDMAMELEASITEAESILVEQVDSSRTNPENSDRDSSSGDGSENQFFENAVRSCFDPMEYVGVGEEGDVDGVTVFSNFSKRILLWAFSSSDRVHQYADESSSAWERFVATDMVVEFQDLAKQTECIWAKDSESSKTNSENSDSDPLGAEGSENEFFEAAVHCAQVEDLTEQDLWQTCAKQLSNASSRSAGSLCELAFGS